MPRKRSMQTESYYEILPTRLRELFETSGATQQEVASAISKTRQSVGYYLDGTSSPDWKTLVALAKHFDVSTDWLLGVTNIHTQGLEVREICLYTGLNEDSVVWLHGLAEDRFSKDILESLNQFMATHQFEYLLSYANYVGEIARESEENEDKRPFLDSKDIARAVNTVKESMLQAGLVGYQLVDADRFADHAKGELQSMFMSVFERLFVKEWCNK